MNFMYGFSFKIIRIFICVTLINVFTYCLCATSFKSHDNTTHNNTIYVSAEKSTRDSSDICYSCFSQAQENLEKTLHGLKIAVCVEGGVFVAVWVLYAHMYYKVREITQRFS